MPSAPDTIPQLRAQSKFASQCLFRMYVSDPYSQQSAQPDTAGNVPAEAPVMIATLSVVMVRISRLIPIVTGLESTVSLNEPPRPVRDPAMSRRRRPVPDALRAIEGAHDHGHNRNQMTTRWAQPTMRDTVGFPHSVRRHPNGELHSIGMDDMSRDPLDNRTHVSTIRI